MFSQRPEITNKRMHDLLGESADGRGQKLSHVELKSEGEEAAIILCTAVACEGRLIFPSPRCLTWVMWPEQNGAWAPAHRYLCWWALLPGATNTAAAIPCSFIPSSLFSVTVSCQIIVRWQTLSPPSTKVSGFRTQAEANIIMGARTGHRPLSRQGDS